MLPCHHRRKFCIAPKMTGLGDSYVDDFGVGPAVSVGHLDVERVVGERSVRDSLRLAVGQTICPGAVLREVEE